MKMKLIKSDDEEQSKGRGFIKRVKKKSDLPFPEQASVTIYNLRENGSCFLKDSVEDFNLSK